MSTKAEHHAETKRITEENLARWRGMEIEKVEVLDSGNGDDCPACMKLVAKGPVPIAEAPSLPPAACTCVPWCRCVMIATE